MLSFYKLTISTRQKCYSENSHKKLKMAKNCFFPCTHPPPLPTGSGNLTPWCDRHKRIGVSLSAQVPSSGSGGKGVSGRAAEASPCTANRIDWLLDSQGRDSYLPATLQPRNFLQGRGQEQ